MRKTPPGQTLQPTALVHEAYVRVLGKETPSFENRAHFFFAAARAMCDILVEQARRKASLKRGGDRRRVSAQHLVTAIAAPAEDMLALNDELERLERDHPRQHQLVMLRFFGGLSVNESAEILGVDVRTVRRDWQFVRAWLYHRLTAESRTQFDDANAGTDADG